MTVFNMLNIKKSKFSKKLMAFLGMPLIFSVIAYVLVYFFAQPLISPLLAVTNLAFSSNAGREVYSGKVFELVDIKEPVDETIPASSISFPKYGDQYARVCIEGTKVDTPVFFGDSKELLKKGAAQYIGSKLPGFGGTIIIGAHKTTHFKDLESVKIGDSVTIVTSYGVYKYTVNDLKVVDPKDTTAYDLGADHENLILYTCYPFNMMGFSKKRYFVYAEYTSGPVVDVSK